jgi:hypothetical protein
MFRLQLDSSKTRVSLRLPMAAAMWRAVSPFCEKKTFYVRVARFFLVQYTKTWKNIPYYYKIYQMAVKYIKCPLNRPTFLK